MTVGKYHRMHVAPLGESSMDRERLTLQAPWKAVTPILGVALVIVGSVSAIRFMQGVVETSNDFTPDYVSAKEWLQGGDPYAQLDDLIAEHMPPGSVYETADAPNQTNTHPPASIVLVSPLSLLPYSHARAIWMIINALSTVIALGIVMRKLKLPHLLSWSMAGASLALPVVQSDLQWGQWNGMTLLLLTGAWVLGERDRVLVSGLLLGAAIALRIFPGLILVALLAAKRIRPAVASAVAAAVLTLTGSALIGWERAATLLLRHSPDNLDWWYSLPGNISLATAPLKLLTGRWSSLDVGVWANVVAGAMMLLCVVGAWWVGRRSTDQVPVISVLPWALLASPLLWEHYLVLLLPLLVAALASWSSLTWGVRVAISIAGPMVALVGEFAQGIASVAPDEPWLVIGAYQLLTGAVVVLGLISVCLMRPREGSRQIVSPLGQG